MGSAVTLVNAKGGFKADSALILPSFPDTTTANRSQFIKFYAGNTIRVADTVYIRNSTATKWINIGGGGAGYTTTSKLNDSSYRLIRPDNTADTFVYTSSSSSAIDTTSLSDRINLKLNISDTSSMLLPYLRKIDTTSKWVNNITRTPGKDSIIFFIGGTRYAIKDSTGGGGVTGGARAFSSRGCGGGECVGGGPGRRGVGGGG